MVVRNRGSTDSAEPVVIEAAQSRIEGTVAADPSKVPEQSGGEDATRRDEQPMGVLEGSSSEALQRENNIPSDPLGIINIGNSPVGPTFSEGKFQEARPMETPDVGPAHEGNDIFRDCFAGVEDGPDPDASFIFDEAQRFLKQVSSLSSYLHLCLFHIFSNLTLFFVYRPWCSTEKHLPNPRLSYPDVRLS